MYVVSFTYSISARIAVQTVLATVTHNTELYAVIHSTHHLKLEALRLDQFQTIIPQLLQGEHLYYNIIVIICDFIFVY